MPAPHPTRAPGRAVRRLLLLAVLAGVAGCAQGASGPEDPLLVAAASDLMPAFSELGESFEAATGQPVVFAFGSSGQLAQQILEGARMEVYAAADAAFVDRVLAGGIGDPTSRRAYAFGRLVVWSRTERWGGWGTLGEVLDDPSVRTIAIANPDHAPYGAAARQALTHIGSWEAAAPRLVFGDNVADTQRLAASGNADVALLARSLAVAAEEQGQGRWFPVAEDLHDPLRQELLVLTGEPDRAELARRFVEHVTSEHGRAVLRRYGFVLPSTEED